MFDVWKKDPEHKKLPTVIYVSYSYTPLDTVIAFFKFLTVRNSSINNLFKN